MPISLPSFRQLTAEERGSPLSSAITGLLGGLDYAQNMKSKRLSDMLVERQMEEQAMRQKYLEPSLQAQLSQEQGRASALPGQMERQKQKEELDNAVAKLLLQQRPQQFSQEQSMNAARTKQLELENQFSPKMNAAKLKQLELENQFYPQLQEAKKSQMMSGDQDELTKANVTKNQSVIQSIDSVLPLIKSIKPSESPGRLFGKYISPNQEAAYKSKTSTITDILVSALGLPKTDSSIHLINEIIMRGKGEDDESYQKRLDELMNDLTSRKKDAVNAIKHGVGNNEKETKLEDPLGIR